MAVPVLLLLVMGMSPALSPDDSEYPVYTGPEFQTLYEYAVANTLPNLEPPNGRFEITGNVDLDQRIWERAIERGYAPRPVAMSDLPSIGGVRMQPGAAQAWEELRAEAREAGMRFVVSSAYRSPEAQRTQFLSKLSGSSDSAIDAALTWYSIPGTSKHHSGYALDFRYSEGTFGGFRSTPDYAWLAADNFAIPKRHGLLPSYPDDGLDQGPNPEPWEFVWVSRGLILCGMPQPLAITVSGPAEAIVEDLSRCPGGPAPAEIPGWLPGT